MRKPLVAGNWKMNGSLGEALALVSGIKGGADKVKSAEMLVCPPYVYLAAVADMLKGSGIALGAQNVSHQSPGAFTGEVAAEMLRDVGCASVIIGHSERRALYQESDELVAQKHARARSVGLRPIVCVGEQLQEREAGETEQVVARQLDAVIAIEGIEALADSVIAYEPVWAIGTGKTATPDQAQAVHKFIRGRLANASDRIASAMQVLYGGSVKANNAAELFAMPDIDGGLIGGASLEADGFLAICEAAG